MRSRFPTSWCPAALLVLGVAVAAGFAQDGESGRRPANARPPGPVEAVGPGGPGGPAETEAGTRGATEPGAVSARPLDGVAARVEGAVITWNDVRRTLGSAMKQMGFTRQAEREEKLAMLAFARLRLLIENKLLLKRALAEGVEVPPEAVEAAFQRDVRSVGSLEEFEKVLAEQGLTVPEKKVEIRKEFLRRWYVESTCRRTPWSNRVRAFSLEVRPADMKAYYRAHREDYRRRAAVWIRQAHVSSAEHRAGRQAEAVARAAAEDLARGMSPAEVDAKYGLGAPQFTCDADELDGIRPDSGILRVVKEWAFQAARGAVLGPLPQPGSGDFKIFYLEKRQEETVRGFGEVQDEIRTILRQQLFQRAQAEIVRSLLQDADVEPPEVKAFMLDPRRPPRLRRDVMLALLDGAF